jgi:peptidoglycan-associated lipoprotein
MKSLPTYLILLSLASFVIGCATAEVADPKTQVEQTEEVEQKSQELVSDEVPEQEAVEKKQTQIIEEPKEESKEEPEVAETEQPSAQKKLKVADVVQESPKPADVKKVKAPEKVPDTITQEQTLRSDVQEARAVLEEAVAKVEAAATAEEMAAAVEIQKMAEEAVIKVEKGEADAPEKVEAVKEVIKKSPKEAVTIIAAPLEEVAIPIEELGIVYFDYDKSSIKPEFMNIIQSNFEWLINNPDIRVQLEGHCDERGTNEYNLALGERRARSVLNYLLRLGANAEQFSIVSFGEERPVALGQNEAAWQKNRRVEFTRL